MDSSISVQRLRQPDSLLVVAAVSLCRRVWFASELDALGALPTAVRDLLVQLQSLLRKDPPQYHYELVRLKSYATWPVEFLAPNDMARAGFYFFRSPDVVRCFACGVQIGSWNEGDDPIGDHRKFASTCRFLNGAPTANVPLDPRLARGWVQSDVTRHCDIIFGTYRADADMGRACAQRVFALQWEMARTNPNTIGLGRRRTGLHT